MVAGFAQRQEGPNEPPPVRAAQYVRMSTEHQQYSTENQGEAFTYNKRINRLATIQEHYMIVRALKKGVSEEKLVPGITIR